MGAQASNTGTHKGCPYKWESPPFVGARITIMFTPELHRRRSIRLKHYDYAQAGLYYFTICAQSRLEIFGEVIHGEMRLNHAGQIAWSVWESLPGRYPSIELDSFIVMPNHIHGIICIVGSELSETAVPSDSFTTIIGAFKSLLTLEYIRGVKGGMLPPFAKQLLQRNYFEHVIRNNESLCRIREYIENNPAQWHLDRDNPEATGI